MAVFVRSFVAVLEPFSHQALKQALGVSDECAC